MQSGNNLKISAAAAADMRSHGQDAYPDECCGALLGSAGCIQRVSRLQNIAPDRRHRYEINPSDWLAIERTGAAIGVYHTHPDAPAIPSDFDLERSWPGYLYIILQVVRGTPGDLRAWRIDDSHGASRFAEFTIHID